MHIQLTTHNYQIWQAEKLSDLRYLVFVFKFLICTFAMEQIPGSWWKYHCSSGRGLIRCMDFFIVSPFGSNSFFFFSLWGFADFFTSPVDFFFKSLLCFSQLDVNCGFWNNYLMKLSHFKAFSLNKNALGSQGNFREALWWGLCF